MEADEYRADIVASAKVKLDARRADLVAQLEAELDAVREETGRADAWAVIANDPQKYERAFSLAVKVFAWTTNLDAYSYPDGRAKPFDGEAAARAIIADHLFMPPREGDDLRRWRVSFPFVFGERDDFPNETERFHRRICAAVCELVLGGATRVSAVEKVGADFARGPRTVEDAYDRYRDQLEPLVKLRLIRKRG